MGQDVSQVFGICSVWHLWRPIENRGPHRFIQREASLEDAQLIDFPHEAGSILIPAQSRQCYLFLLSGGLNITQGLRFPSLCQLFGRRGQSSVGTEDLVLLHLFVWRPCGLGT